MAFGGCRTYHRMACAIEDAGFEIRDMIEWVYGSGFPKSLDVARNIDRIVCTKIGKHFFHELNEEQKRKYPDWHICDYSKEGDERRGTGTALKPAHEPICMARKPLSEKTVAENVLKWGTGGINIDKSRVGLNKYDLEEYIPNRVGYKDPENYVNPAGKGVVTNFVAPAHNTLSMMKSGRFPANLIHDNSEEVRTCFPETKTGSIKPHKQATTSLYEHGSIKAGGMITGSHNGDSGNASRFFKSIIYQPKAGKAERGEGNSHPTVKLVALMEYLINMATKEGQAVLDLFLGSGTTAVACERLNRRWIGIEIEEKYCEIAKKRIENERKQRKLF